MHSQEIAMPVFPMQHLSIQGTGFIQSNIFEYYLLPGICIALA